MNSQKLAESNAQYSQNSERAAMLLLALNTNSGAGLALGELSDIVGAEKSAVHRALLALRRHGLVVQSSQRGRYRLGPAARALGHRRSTPVERIQQWKPSLAKLGKTFKASVFLLERSGLDAVITDMYITDIKLPILGNDGLGGRLPLGYGLGGTMIMACQQEGNQTAIMMANQPRYASLGIDVERLKIVLSDAQTRGYDYRRNAVVQGMSGVAMPIHDGDGSCSAAVTVAKSNHDLSEDEVEQIIVAMRKCIQENE